MFSHTHCTHLSLSLPLSFTHTHMRIHVCEYKEHDSDEEHDSDSDPPRMKSGCSNRVANLYLLLITARCTWPRPPFSWFMHNMFLLNCPPTPLPTHPRSQHHPTNPHSAVRVPVLFNSNNDAPRSLLLHCSFLSLTLSSLPSPAAFLPPSPPPSLSLLNFQSHNSAVDIPPSL